MHSIYLPAEASSPVKMLPKFPCLSTKSSLLARTTKAEPMDWSPWGWYFMQCPMTLATLWNLPSSISKRECKMRRWTGLSPSSRSGMALSLMT